MTDPIMERLKAEERRFTRRLWVGVAAWALISGAFGWWLGSLPPRPIVVQFGGPPLQVHISPEPKP